MMAFLGRILGTLLNTVYNVISGLGSEPQSISYYAISIIVTTIIFKLILLPLNIKQSQSTKKMNALQPKLQEIQKKYKDPQTQQIKLQELYKEHNFNPASGCIMPFIQLPIIIAFYRVFQQPVTYAFTPELYASMNKNFFWIANLENPDPYMWGLPLLAALATFLVTKTMAPPAQNTQGNDQMQSTMKTMNIMMPIMIFISARNFAAGIALYWVVNNLLTIVQQLIVNKLD